ncbi:MAG: phosphate ABC transporter substrate-binding protein [Candidatus Eisenbacteria bacterium]|uniref:Phosphate-binding protein n=1 Tax=Eiseniibacteriota bacterium TaxID=2212470 RepID=A0A933SDC6_UNCEI|nr:phosphate ABC transporter substrate-binding protein [Candidatus Eisenbacteria bacterium]
MKFFRTLPLAVALATLALAAVAFAGRGITVKGSDTMVILGQRWAEQYMNQNRGQIVQVTGGGSGTGIAALINGTTDICQSSRPMKQDEKLKLRDRYQTMGVEIPVAKDGLSVFVHETNPVKDLSLAQLKQIYTGAVTNWKQVGGKDATIVLYGRENSSGTYGFFKDHVLDGRDFAASCQTLPGTAAVVNAVSRDPNGVGYGGAAYTKGVRDCPVRKDAKSPAIMPTAATVRDGSYPLSRDLYFYLRKPAQGDVKKFIDWVLSPAGQKLAVEVGYYPLK